MTYDAIKSWTALTKLLPGRSGNDVRNRYKALERKHDKKNKLPSDSNAPEVKKGESGLIFIKFILLVIGVQRK